jgi:hypothetical protein
MSQPRYTIEARQAGTHNKFRRMYRRANGRGYVWAGPWGGTLVRTGRAQRSITAAQRREFTEWCRSRNLQPRIRIIASTVQAAQHRIIGRQEWGARPARNHTVARWPRGTRPVIHHTAGRGTFATTADEHAELRAIQHYHQTVNGWADIGYHFIVFPSGNVYQGRAQATVGAHARNANHRPGIAFPGNYERQLLTSAQVAAYEWLVATLGFGAGEGHYRIPGNATACPGKHIKQRLGA